MSENATLKDLINYDVDLYLSEDELSLIRSTFKGNKALLKVLRKVFMPTAFDPELPIEELSKDAWMADKDFSLMQNEEIKSIVLARQDTIKFILGGLVKIKMLANEKQESEQSEIERRTKDSTK